MEGQSCGQFYRGVLNSLRTSFYCKICCREYEGSQLKRLGKCGHKFCQECLNTYFRIKLMTYQQIQCPLQDCTSVVDTNSSFWKGLPLQLQRRYNKFQLSQQKQKDVNFRACPLNNCTGNIVFKGNAFKCTLCSQNFCLNCLSKVHEGKCDFEEAGYLSSILKLRRCPKCKFLIQKSQGCSLMKCRCGCEFCFDCNGPSIGYGHYCRRDQYSRVIVNRPKFKSQAKIQTALPQTDFFQSEPSTKLESIKYILFMMGFVVPYYILTSFIFILKMILPSFALITKLVVLFLLMVVLGMGPFTVQFVNNFTGIMRKILIILFPLTTVIGIYVSFKELSPAMGTFAIDGFIRRRNKVVKELYQVK